MPISMKRKAYVEITGKNTFRISSNYDTRDFKINEDEANLFVDLVTLELKKLDCAPIPEFYAGVWYSPGDGVEVEIYNTQNTPFCLATLGFSSDFGKQVCIHTTVIYE